MLPSNPVREILGAKWLVTPVGAVVVGS